MIKDELEWEDIFDSFAIYPWLPLSHYQKIPGLFQDFQGVCSHFSRTRFVYISMCTTKVSTVQYNVNGYNFENMYLTNHMPAR
jgi:hypothetical protein